MSYIPLEEYNKAWIFRHRDLAIPADKLAEIKPLTAARSEQIWHEHISRQSDHPDFFGQGDWAAAKQSWLEQGSWQSEWDADDHQLPALLAEHLQEWDDNITVFFCYQSDHVIETKWSVFRQHWKNFLFFDNGPLLIGKRRTQVAQFFDNGRYRIGHRG